MPRSPHQLTLREMLTELERMVSEMVEHMDRGFVPKVREFRRSVLPDSDDPEDDPVDDFTIRSQAADLIKRDLFTKELYDIIEEYFGAISTSVTGILDS